MRPMVSVLRWPRGDPLQPSGDGPKASTISSYETSTPRSTSPGVTASGSSSCCSTFFGAMPRGPCAACRWGAARICSTIDAHRRRSSIVVVPAVARAIRAASRAILAWDIINEPEWITTVKPVEIDAFLSREHLLVRSSTAPARHRRVGGHALARSLHGARPGFLSGALVRRLKHQPSLDTPVSQLGFDRPVLLGEFPTRGSRRTPENIVATARSWYSGAFYWSALSDEIVPPCLQDETLPASTPSPPTP